jgi:uncharacterized SAM-binding protein YcdF (DUF218 family)
VASIPDDPGTHVDAIVVLGRGLPLRLSRVEVAAKLWKADRAPTILLVVKEMLPIWLSACERKAFRLRYSLAKTAPLAPRRTLGSRLLCCSPKGYSKFCLTDSPHMLRSLLSFRSFGFTVIPHPIPPSQLNPKDKGFEELREYGGLVFYSLLGWFCRSNYLELGSKCFGIACPPRVIS